MRYCRNNCVIKHLFKLTWNLHVEYSQIKHYLNTYKFKHYFLSRKHMYLKKLQYVNATLSVAKNILCFFYRKIIFIKNSEKAYEKQQIIFQLKMHQEIGKNNK